MNCPETLIDLLSGGMSDRGQMSVQEEPGVALETATLKCVLGLTGHFELKGI